MAQYTKIGEMLKRFSVALFVVLSAMFATAQLLTAAPDVTFWTVRPTGTAAHLRGVACGAQTFVAAGDRGTILRSSESGWNQIESGSTNDLTGIAWGNGAFVAIGTVGTILRSPDGINWARHDTGVDETLRSITFGNDRFLTLGSSNCLVSPDGVSWTEYSVPMMNVESVCFGNGRFVSVGGGSVLVPEGEIRESTDGATWRLWPQGTAVYHDIVFANGYFTAVGEGMGSHIIQRALLWRAPGVVEQGGAEVFSDTNVETHRGIAFGDGMFVSVGGTRAVPNPWWIGKISSSPTGANPWTSEDRLIDPWPQTYFQLDHLLLDVTYGNGKFVAVGESGTVVESGAAVRFDPRLSRVRANGRMEFAVLSPVNSRVQVDFANGDLLKWSTLLTVTNSSGTFTFQVTPLSLSGYLRAVLLAP